MSAKTARDLPADEPAVLVSRLRNGDQAALAEVLRRYGPKFEGWLKRDLSFLQPFSDDILAGGLVRLWESRDWYDPTQMTLENWFFRLCKCELCDLLKQAWHKARLLERRVDLEELTDHKPAELSAGGPPGELSPLGRDLAMILNGLSERDRTIILAWARAEGKDGWASGLADELGMLPGTLRVRRLRIFRTIRKALRTLGHETPEST
jgi:DNA-directed RNA polymerase specialized sigma24 family protein